MTQQVVHPRTQDQVTPEWLTAVLREADVLNVSSEVSSLESEVIGVGRGYACTTVRLRMEYAGYAGGAPKSLVLKIPNYHVFEAPGMTAEQTAFMKGLCLSEGAWYRDLQQGCALRAPTSPWQGIDQDAGAALVLLEDLSDLRTVGQSEGLTEADARVVVTALAKAQASWWEQPSVRGLSWLRPGEAVARYFQEQMVENWDASARLYGASLGLELTAHGRSVAENMIRLSHDAAKSGSTLAHGDYRAENFLFPPDDDPGVVVLDWQFVHWGSGLRDLAYCLSQNLDDDARQSEMDLVRLYHDVLCANGVMNYAWGQCLEDYRRGLLTALSIPLSGGNIVEAWVRSIKEGSGDAEADAFAAYVRSIVELFNLMCSRASASIEAFDALQVLPVS